MGKSGAEDGVSSRRVRSVRRGRRSKNNGNKGEVEEAHVKHIGKILEELKSPTVNAIMLPPIKDLRRHHDSSR